MLPSMHSKAHLRMRVLRYAAMMVFVVFSLIDMGCRNEPAANTPSPPPHAENTRENARRHPSFDNWGKTRNPRPDSGRWREARPHAPEAESNIEAIEQLEAIGYLTGSVTGETRKDVVLHDRTQAWQGLNFYFSGHGPEAALCDMDGNLLHRWRRSFGEIWPKRKEPLQGNGKEYWRRGYLYPNGDLIAIFEGCGIVKVDKESKVLWANPVGAHHDLAVDSKGLVHVLTRKAHVVKRLNPKAPILEDYITTLNGNGEIVSSLSVLECIENSPFNAEFRHRKKQLNGDLLHTNTLKLLTGSNVKKNPAFKKGNYLVSFCYIHTVAVIDPVKRSVVWWKQGDYRFQHEPQVLRNGHLLIFDNKGRPGASSVLECTVDTGNVVWRYRGTEEHPFCTRTCGAAWRQPNGNTLIVESDGGRAFEITPSKEIVWEFFNPNRAGKDKQFIATLFDMKRFPLDFGKKWLMPTDSAKTPPAPGSERENAVAEP